MAKKQEKLHYYLLVFTDEGPVFLTKLLAGDRAEFNKLERPLELSKGDAEAIQYGFAWHSIASAVVVQRSEISYQPFDYKRGHWEWKWNDKE